MIQRLIPICILGLSGAAAGVSAAEPVELPQLVVHEQRIVTPSISVLNPEDPDVGMPSDGADFLRRVPGVSASRMGGHGLEPVIRGQSQGRLNILLDGAYLHGGCPNRMDPPSSFVPVETYDRIVVIKGAQSVRYGGGGSGGTVLFERDTHPLAASETVRGQLGGGLTTNSRTKDAFADVTFGGPQT